MENNVREITRYKDIPVYFDQYSNETTVTACWKAIEEGYVGLCYMSAEGTITLEDGSPVPQKSDNRSKVQFFLVNCEDADKIQEMCQKYEDAKGLITEK